MILKDYCEFAEMRDQWLNGRVKENFVKEKMIYTLRKMGAR